jgi:hypothetical protein
MSGRNSRRTINLISYGFYLNTTKLNGTGILNQNVILSAAYHIVATIVLLNMLIGLMAKTYTNIKEEAATEWMYARTQVMYSCQIKLFHYL